MKHIQGTKITGYVTILVTGENPELFFQKLTNQGINTWDINKINESKCTGKIALKDIKYVKQTRRKTNYKISFIQRSGAPFLVKRYLKKREILLSFLLSIAFILFLSNIVWDIQIQGVTKDVEEKIEKQLNSYGIHRGSLIHRLGSTGKIQQNLLADVPDLLWIGVHKQGTTLFLEGVEKEIVERKEIEGPTNLIAAKNGVIEKMYISKGQAVVNVNDYVKKGDLLVSGVIETKVNDDEEEEEEEEKGPSTELVAAEGVITANTWYEVDVTVPLEAKYEILTGHYQTKYYLRINEFNIPVWGFGSTDYEHIYREIEDKPIYFLKWKLPISFHQHTLHEKQFKMVNRTKEEAINKAIEQAKNELKLKYGSSIEFLSENVLHEDIESGKVKVKLYISVLEDIAKEEEIKESIS